MITAGIDIGTENVKVVLVQDGAVIARACIHTGFEPGEATHGAVKEALVQAGLAPAAVQRTVTTGAGRKEFPRGGEITEVAAAAGGIHHIHPDVVTVVDVGAEEGRCVKVGDGGRVIDFVVNDRCAAGTGAFIEAMARALEVSLDEFGRISLASARIVPLGAQCAVFAESEVIGLLHSGAAKEDIARAVHDSITSRLVSMVRRIGIEERLALVGGVALSAGLREVLELSLETDVLVPDHPQHVGALGAALAAARR